MNAPTTFYEKFDIFTVEFVVYALQKIFAQWFMGVGVRIKVVPREQSWEYVHYANECIILHSNKYLIKFILCSLFTTYYFLIQFSLTNQCTTWETHSTEIHQSYDEIFWSTGL